MYILRQPELCEFVGEPGVPYKSKHIKIKYHYIRDMVQRGAMKLQYFVTHKQIGDVFTKPLARVKFEYFREELGVLQIEVPSKGR